MAGPRPGNPKRFFPRRGCGGWNGGALTQRIGTRNEMNTVVGYSLRAVRTLNVQ
jgi:hypothetical protein